MMYHGNYKMPKKTKRRAPATRDSYIYKDTDPDTADGGGGREIVITPSLPLLTYCMNPTPTKTLCVGILNPPL